MGARKFDAASPSSCTSAPVRGFAVRVLLYCLDHVAGHQVQEPRPVLFDRIYGKSREEMMVWKTGGKMYARTETEIFSKAISPPSNGSFNGFLFGSTFRFNFLRSSTETYSFLTGLTSRLYALSTSHTWVAFDLHTGNMSVLLSRNSNPWYQPLVLRSWFCRYCIMSRDSCHCLPVLIIGLTTGNDMP